MDTKWWRISRRQSRRRSTESEGRREFPTDWAGRPRAVATSGCPAPGKAAWRAEYRWEYRNKNLMPYYTWTGMTPATQKTEQRIKDLADIMDKPHNRVIDPIGNNRDSRNEHTTRRPSIFIYLEILMTGRYRHMIIIWNGKTMVLKYLKYLRRACRIFV